MTSTNWRNIAEFVGLASIVASLVLVAYELQQNTAISTAQAIAELNSALDASYRARAQDAALDKLVIEGHSDPDALSERERSQFFAWLRADVNSAESVWFYYDAGIIPERSFDGFVESFCSRVATPGGKEWWLTEAKFYASGFQEEINAWCF